MRDGNLHDFLLILPVAVPLLSAALCGFALHSARLRRALGMGGLTAYLAVAIVLFITVEREGVIVTALGSWPAPFGIVLVADLFSAMMVLITGIMAILAGLTAIGGGNTQRGTNFWGLLHLLIMGVSGAFLTGDIFNLFVWFELTLLSSFVLLVLNGGRNQMEGAIKYVTLNLMASFLFLAAVGILYGRTGSLNMADLAERVAASTDPQFFTPLAMLFLTSFGIKAGIFPLYFWLPAAYHTAPIYVTALFSALLTKLGVYALVRMFTLVFTGEAAFNNQVLLVLAGLTMLSGVLGAVAQYDLRRLLSFHIISQIGYLIMGLGLGSTLALAGLIYFMAHVIFAKAGLFFVGGLVRRHAGTYDLKRLGGLYATHPGLAVLFLLPALSLAGIPPFSGFWAKLSLVRAGLEAEQYLLVGTALFVGMLTLYSMIKIWNEAFWKAQPAGESPEDPPWDGWRLLVPVFTCAFAVCIMGLAADPFFDYALRAAEQLLAPEIYIQAVKGLER